jgi:hypothetical protein
MADKRKRHEVTVTFKDVYVNFPVMATSLEEAIKIARELDPEEIFQAACKDGNGYIDVDSKSVNSVCG